MATKKTKNPALLNRRPTWKKDELYVLWAKCAGRCEICNKILYENNYTLDRVKHGQLAHIIAHSENHSAPRVDETTPKEIKDSIENIILLCGECHKTVDNDPITYTTVNLQKIKKDFEDKIEAQTTPTFDKSRKIILFSAPIFNQGIQISEEEAISALKEYGQYPKGHAIEIFVPYVYKNEYDPDYWIQAKNYIDKAYKEKIELMVNNQEKITVFGMAPQPLLAYFGWKIGEKVNKQVFQWHRDQPNVWSWPISDKKSPRLEVHYPKNYFSKRITDKEQIAIALNVSFDISQRIREQLTSNSLLWEVHPENKQYSTDFVKHPEQLNEFRVLIQNLLNDVSKIAETNPIHIYSAMPVSMALTLGMTIMPKANNPIIMHDYLKSTGLDVEVLKFNI